MSGPPQDQTMRCALLQINTKVGDVARNAELIAARAAEAAARGAALALTPEMALTGYPPRDLLLYPSLAEEAEQAARALAARLAGGPALVLGSIGRNLSGRGQPLFNQALFLQDGRVRAVYNKRLLPTYDIFDEARYFEPGAGPVLVEFQGRRLALTICEDIWNDDAFRVKPYAVEPLADHPPFDLLINISASPFTRGKQTLRQNLLTALARRRRAHFLYANLVGGNDDLIFDGRSLWVGPEGELLARGRGFAEDLVLVDLDCPEPRLSPDDFTPEAEGWRALTLGLRDYCGKVGLRRVVLGLSGGIDSSLTACLAAAALGPENVCGLLMPSPYSSAHSLADARALARNLKINAETLPITPLMRAYEEALAAPFAGLASDAAEENLQARIRGNLLMAFANKFQALLLTTGNKSEMSVGYCTIYGDMCGGLAVIGDLYKTEVFSLCRWLNAGRERPPIPPNVLLKPPSAELRPDQTDQDSLPSYDELDRILKGLLEERRSAAELAAAGFRDETVRRVAGLVQAAEFKRRQAAPVLKITASAFGPGWRMPIACRSVYS